jgi:hypothetical protein
MARFSDIHPRTIAQSLLDEGAFGREVAFPPTHAIQFLPAHQCAPLTDGIGFVFIDPIVCKTFKANDFYLAWRKEEHGFSAQQARHPNRDAAGL